MCVFAQREVQCIFDHCFLLWNQFPLVAVFSKGENLMACGPSEDQNVNSYWKPSIVKIWNPINIMQVWMHLSNEKPRDWLGFPPFKSGLPISWVMDDWNPKMGLRMVGKGSWASPWCILVMCIWLCHLILFLKWNLICWKIPSWWINELREVLALQLWQRQSSIITRSLPRSSTHMLELKGQEEKV